MRTSNVDIDEPFTMRKRTRSPGAKRPVQFAAGGLPFTRYVYAWPPTSARSLGAIRIRPHSSRSSSVARKPSRFASRVKSPSVRWL